MSKISADYWLGYTKQPGLLSAAEPADEVGHVAEAQRQELRVRRVYVRTVLILVLLLLRFLFTIDG